MNKKGKYKQEKKEASYKKQMKASNKGNTHIPTEKFVFEAAVQCGRRVLLAFHALGTFASQHRLSQLLTTAW